MYFTSPNIFTVFFNWESSYKEFIPNDFHDFFKKTKNSKFSELET